MINLKDHYYIIGLDDNEKITLDPTDVVLYQGKTSEITEELATLYVKSKTHKDWKEDCIIYIDYNDSIGCFHMAKESILSACKKEMCVLIERKGEIEQLVMNHLKINNRTIFEEYGLIWQNKSILFGVYKNYALSKVEELTPTTRDAENIGLEQEYEPE